MSEHEENPDKRKRENELIKRADFHNTVMQLIVAEMARGVSMNMVVAEAKRTARSVVEWLDEVAPLTELGL